MHTTIPAIVDNGVFRPEEPISLPEGTRVILTVNVEDQERQKRREAIEEFIRISQEIGFDSGGDRLTRDQLHERR